MSTGSVLGGRYLLLRRIGSGGMGAVFEAEHTITKRRVALKLIHQGLIENSPTMADRFIREAQAPAAIRHPAIVEVLDAGQDPDGRLFLVFELLEGRTLGAALKDQTVEPRGVVRVAMGVLSGLEALHARGLVHRDVKPENVFLVDGSIDQVKLLDFGIAKDLTDEAQVPLTRPGHVLGTARYMSPEQAAGAPIDARADLWAVGAVLYRAFAGPVHLKQRPILSVATVCPAISPPLASVIDRALMIEPGDRWQTASEMRAALEAIDVSAVVSPPKRNRIRIGAAIAWFAAILTAMLLLLGRQETTPSAAQPAATEHEGEAVLQTTAGEVEEPAPPPSRPLQRVRKKKKRAPVKKPEPAKKIESPWSQPKREFGVDG